MGDKMKAQRTMKPLRWAASAATLALILGAAFVHGTSQAAAPSATAPSIQLQPYTAPDQSASAGVPSGWNVTKGEQTVIQMNGPQGETIFLGNTMIARNAPFQLGQKGAGGADLSMPYSAPLAQKLTMILQQAAAIAGRPPSPVTITSATPLQLPKPLGQCGRFVATGTAAQGPMKFMGAICSLPLDTGGTYKNVMLLAQSPPASAAQDAPIATAVFHSYRISMPMLQRKLAPFTAPPPLPMVHGSGPGAMPMPMPMPMMDNTSADCFDLVVIRETPNYQLPRKCGGQAPD
jgi:hypothetical protein